MMPDFTWFTDLDKRHAPRAHLFYQGKRLGVVKRRQVDGQYMIYIQGGLKAPMIELMETLTEVYGRLVKM